LAIEGGQQKRQPSNLMRLLQMSFQERRLVQREELILAPIALESLVLPLHAEDGLVNEQLTQSLRLGCLGGQVVARAQMLSQQRR